MYIVYSTYMYITFSTVCDDMKLEWVLVGIGAIFYMYFANGFGFVLFKKASSYIGRYITMYITTLLY